MTITCKQLSRADVARAYEFEQASYPADEAASLSALEYRQRHASDYFRGAYDQDEQLVGFICSTLTSSSTLTHESMETHEPAGTYLAIHSVCVSPAHRRQGIAKTMLNDYVATFAQPTRAHPLQGIRLIAKENLVAMYEHAGFVSRGKSKVVHGQDPWYELGIDFNHVADSTPTFERDEVSPETRSPAKRLAYDLSRNRVGTELTTDGNNRFDLYCPRAECRCLLVKAGAAKWVIGAAQDLELPALPHKLGSTSSARESKERLGYWTLSSPLAFENIGFTRSVPTSSNSSTTEPPHVQIKYLTCADCDFGPLGWHDTQGTDLGVEVQEENERGGGQVRQGREFLLDLERVRYKI
ncbi:polyamine acetyltransferase [Sporobolomyces koalae]|uniref:polyamine acetyltransferase n=1 Tax=Sporobolomyces koalae TaxID=500713 RepID=UPI0031740529